ncbi:hypothetical protein TBLA_0B09440 [Henningerozyma blattae CBS 6284]|uniref:C2H2-type domain-containing protein n=1 Tax=Henningerozyma blattae (strain ATCC 34711 / CBS 6284 / DSM 70876 / NBRC 10599 / NRRL Y-10934 / UCD 77-7) TaxID=1071380 RepID=I2H059_HENB6|nr:hypothetical protein TBLA_0B09440 [Tetrapisispora blattae CBS 6284]CCH59761.1 hypothetical protein TBLA_0B09440 [Tetrapisispora blattae CBS 6284]
MSNFGRRTWNRDEYLIVTDQNSQHHQNLNDSDLLNLKKNNTNYDNLLKNTLLGLNKKILTENVTSSKRGKQFGFHCELCNLTFKDNLQFIDHLNHKTHAIVFENLFDEPLVLDKRDNDDVPLQEIKDQWISLMDQFVNSNLDKSLIKKKRSKKIRKISTVEEPKSEVESMMGFSSFGSTKK